jgi:hypothetical protein
MRSLTYVAALIIASIALPLTIYAATKFVKASEYGDVWPFPTEKGGSLNCKDLGKGRRAVWLDGATATYALNADAMAWMKKAGLKGVGGGPVKRGQDFSIDAVGLGALLEDGLRLCD